MGFVWVHVGSFLHRVASPFHSFVTTVTVPLLTRVTLRKKKRHGIAKNDNNNDTNQTTNPTMQPPTANELMTRMPAYVTHLGCAVNPL